MNLDEAVLRHTLNILSVKKQLAFALLVCERMMPAFYKFARETQFNSGLYERCLETAWHYLAGTANVSTNDAIVRECFDGAPDTEDFDHHLTSAALSAALSIAATMSFLVEHSIDHVVEVARLAYETAALYGQPFGTTTQRSRGLKDIISHPLVQNEAQRQMDDLKYLKSLPDDISKEIVTLIRERGRNAPKLPEG